MAEQRTLNSVQSFGHVIIPDLPEGGDFPTEAQKGQLLLKGGQLWNYGLQNGIWSWHPITQPKSTHVHTQVSKAETWQVFHGLDTQNISLTVYSKAADGTWRLVANPPVTFVDDNNIEIPFAESIDGKAIILSVGGQQSAASVIVPKINELRDELMPLIGSGGGIDGITSVDGKIGIGTSPSYPLDVQSTGDTVLRVKANSSGAGADTDAIIRLDSAETGEGLIDFFHDGIKEASIEWASSHGELNIRTQAGTNGVIDFQPNNSLAMRIDSSGKVGIGTAPATALHVKSTSPVLYLQDSNAANTTGVGAYIDFRDQNDNRAGYVGFGSGSDHLFRIHNNSGSPFRYRNDYGYCDIGPINPNFFHFYTDRSHFYFNKNCQASGGFTTYSDERLKENITVVENAVDALKKIRGVSFTWRTNVDSQERREGKMFGVLAQEVLQIDPEMCEQPEPVVDGDEKYYTFDYSNLTPYFIEAIKEQQAKIDSLEARIAALETKI